MNDVQTQAPLIPPEETAWQKYSPHFELPIAGATSLILHGVVIGVLLVAGLASFFSLSAEGTKPARMDVVVIEGGGGFEGGGGEPGLPGPVDGSGAPRTENVQQPQDQQPETPRPSQRPVEETLPELGVPAIDDGTPPLNNEVFHELQKLAKEADDAVKRAMQIPAALTPALVSKEVKVVPKGTNNPKGIGGLGGSGGGLGAGKRKGPGTGGGGPGGRQVTDQEAKAWRWRFDLAGDAKEHARKLGAIGVLVAVPDPRGGFILITDLNRRPVDMKKDSLAAFKDAVKWYNTKLDSVQPLARELQLPFVPKFVVMLLPKEREQKMVQEETRYANEHRRNVENIQMTLFDFQLRNGVYEPVVRDQK
jgi:hypothetical protein